MYRSIFVSHGAPTLVLEDRPATRFMRELGAALGRPRAIVCVSAHWETEMPAVSLACPPETIHDFHGFPEALYRLRYPAPGAPEVGRRVARLLEEAGLACHLDPDRGLDHGAWVPMMLAWPEADVPVTQLSIQHHLGTRHHLRVGEALAPLADEGVLVLGSGSATHNLGEAIGALRSGQEPGSPSEWARAFEAWLVDRVAGGDTGALCEYRRLAPHGARAHPRDEHFLPLLVAAGAGGGRGRALHRSFTLGSLAMDAFGFPA